MRGGVAGDLRRTVGETRLIALVTGASGCLGWALCERLLADPRITEVRGLVRRPDVDLPEGIQRFVGELADGESLKVAASGVDLVFHLAALVHAPEGSPKAFHEANVVGTGRLLDALDRDSPPRVIFLSTVAVYGEATAITGIAEMTEPAPATLYAASKLAAEGIVRTWSEREGGLCAILRVATVYGARDRGNMASMLRAIRDGKFLLLDGGRAKKTIVSARNVAAAAVAAAFAPSSVLEELGPMVVADSTPVTVKSLAAAMAESLGVRPRFLSLPTGLVRLGARLLGSRSPISPIQVKRLAASNVYRLGGLKRITGSEAKQTLPEGLAEAVVWLRKTDD